RAMAVLRVDRLMGRALQMGFDDDARKAMRFRRSDIVASGASAFKPFGQETEPSPTSRISTSCVSGQSTCSSDSAIRRLPHGRHGRRNLRRSHDKTSAASVYRRGAFAEAGSGKSIDL